MAIAKTYTVGDLGGARRLDNLTGPWVDIPISASFPSFSGVLLDVETDPTNGNKVFAVGDGNLSQNMFGIYVSTNGGTTWVIPGGNYQTNINPGGTIRWWEVYVLDSLNIFVAGSNGYIAVSTDGGLTFNLSSQLPTLPTCIGCNPAIPDCQSIHFITPAIGVVGLIAHAAITYNAGATWTILNGGNVIGSSPSVLNAKGIHISANQQTINVLAATGIFRSTDAGNTFTMVHQFLQRNGEHLTWINDNELWGFGQQDEIVKSVNAGATWTTLSPLSIGGPAHRAGHFYQNQNGFYSRNADILATSNGASSGALSETSPYGVIAVWTWFQEPVCYLLTDCSGQLASMLLDWSLLAPFVGQVVQIPALYGNTCWSVTTTPDCQGATIINVNTIINSFVDCVTCNPPQCYTLTECTGTIPPITINDPIIAPYAGEVIEICITTQVGITCYCFTVTGIGPCLNGVPIPTGWDIKNCVEDCNACIPPPPPPLELHPRRIKPGYYTPGCPPAYTEKVNCTFGEQLYDEMVANRYGIHICCDHDVDKWSIKKQILDLKAIYDPDLCKCFLQQCCPPTCVEATLQVFNPIACSPPIGVVPTIIPICNCYEISNNGAFAARIAYRDCADNLVVATVPFGNIYVCSIVYPVILFGLPTITPGNPCINGKCSQ